MYVCKGDVAVPYLCEVLGYFEGDVAVSYVCVAWGCFEGDV